MDGNIYETEKLVSEYLLFHYGTTDQILGWEQGPREALEFPARIVRRFSAGRVERALDVGCAVGRSAFELSAHAGEVIGIDFSQAFVDAAARMGRDGSAPVQRHEEGAHYQEISVALPANLQPDRVRFEQGDAMALREDLGSFERVVAANLLCRLLAPDRFLERLPQLVARGGELILTTPCTWLEEFTPPGNWPPDGTESWLESHLGTDFDLLERHDEPFLIRETARKFQWTVALLTKWRRR